MGNCSGCRYEVQRVAVDQVVTRHVLWPPQVPVRPEAMPEIRALTGGFNSNPLNGLQVPQCPWKITASVTVMGSPCCAAAAWAPTSPCKDQGTEQLVLSVFCLFMVTYQTIVRICYLPAKYLSSDTVLVWIKPKSFKVCVNRRTIAIFFLSSCLGKITGACFINIA